MDKHGFAVMALVRRIIRLALFAPPLVFWGVFYAYPLARILQLSFAPEGGWAPEKIGAAVRQPFFWQVLWFTIWQAAVSTALTLLLGLPLAYVFARHRWRGKSLLQALLTVPFVMPTVVVATAFTTLLGDRGVVNRLLQSLLDLEQPPLQLLQTVWIILLAHVFYNVSVVVRTVGGFWTNLNPRLEEAASLLGADPRRRFLAVTLPLLSPSIFAASLLVFLFCFTSFGVVLILGGVRFATLEVEIYRQAVNLFNLPVAAFLALVQMALTFAMMALYTRLQARASVPLELRPRTPAVHETGSRVARWALAAGVTLVTGALLAPLAALAWQSITMGGEGITFQFYRELALNRRQSAFFAPPVTAVQNSLTFALATTVLSLWLGIASAYLMAQPRRRLVALLEPLFLLPLGTSAVTLGFGYVVSMGQWRTALWLVPVAHTLLAMPFVVRTFLPALRRLDPRLREAAQVLGASPARTWWEIDAPLLSHAVFVSAIFAFCISLGEFGATLLISRPDTPTMPMVIYRALGQPGLLNYGQALAMSTILMVVAGASMLVIERFRPPGGAEF